MKKIYTLVLFVFASLVSSAQCTELFFSEYAEGSSNNKYLEIYNPSNSAIDLSDYSIFQTYGTGSSQFNTFDLTGMLQPNEVYIIATDQASTDITSEADTLLSFPSVVHFNGDDAVALLKGTDTIDAIGILFQRTVWTVGTGNTRNHTLVRKSSVEGPDTAWSTTAVGGWDVLQEDDWTNIGSHASSCDKSNEPATAATEPTEDAEDVISLFSGAYTDVTVDTWRTSWSAGTLEDVQVAGNDVKKYSNLDFVGVEATGANSIDVSGMDYFTFDVWSPDATLYRVKMVDFGADNAFGGGDDTEAEVVFTSPSQGTWNNHRINLADLATLTGREHISQIIFSAQPIGAATLYIDNVYFSREKPYVVSDIADVVQLDADLAPTNEGDRYELTGIVHGIDFAGNAGLSFTLIDETSGINIFNFRDVSDYVVTEGDEIVARGEIDFYYGLLELFVDSIRVVSQGNDLVEPIDIDAPSEETESEYVRLRKVWVADTATYWPSNRNVLFTNENQDTFEIRIDRDAVDVAETPIPFDTMTIVGIGGQYDRDAPYDEGYQVFVYKTEDVTEYVRNTGSVKNTINLVRTYPNPAKSVLNITSDENWNSFEVYSLNGVKQLEGGLYNNSINVNTLVGGNYILKLYGDNAEGVSRFVVLK